MSPPAKSGRARRTAPYRREQQEARRRRLAVLTAIAVVALGTLLVTAFGGGDHPATVPVAPPASAARLLPAGPPLPQVVARIGTTLKLQLPINASRLTAIGYFGSEDGSIALSPVGTQANEGLLKRLVHKIFGSGSGSTRWYLLAGGHGPSTSALDVGAAPGTDVYSPVNGTIVGIGKVVLNGRTYGARIDIQPTDAPSLVVSISHLKADPSLTVGEMVSSDASKLGIVLDFASAEQQALSRYTNDSGNHVLIEVHPSATLQAR
jgi:hypothetical protein